MGLEVVLSRGQSGRASASDPPVASEQSAQNRAPYILSSVHKKLWFLARKSQNLKIFNFDPRGQVRSNNEGEGHVRSFEVVQSSNSSDLSL